MPPASGVELGVRIKAAMFRQGVSGQQVGDALGIGRSTVSQKLHGRVCITVHELLVICGLLDLSPAELLDGLVGLDDEEEVRAHAAAVELLAAARVPSLAVG